jgi:folylpolyglutamate synthase/dihydropteroate synthase
MLRDKAWKEMLAELAKVAGRFVVSPVASTRTVGAEELRDALKELRCNRPVRVVGSAAEAVKAASADPFVAVTGSLYFIGEVMEGLGIEPGASGDERGLNEWGGGNRNAR